MGLTMGPEGLAITKRAIDVMADGGIEAELCGVAPPDDGAASEDVPDLLMIWMSPGFPVGAFAFSHGLEKLVEDGVVCDRGHLEAWLSDLATMGSLRNDLILLAETWRGASERSAERVMNVSELALALQPSAERYLETVTQGAAFHQTVGAAWPAPGAVLHEGREIAYPVAVGLAAAQHGLPLAPTLNCYAIAFVSNLVSAAIRLSVIGQTDGQRTLAALLPLCRRVSAGAAAQSLYDLGSATIASDLASLFHETQYSRLFRS